MRRAVAGFCCVVVGLQLLVGVPLAVCLAFFSVVANGGIGPLAFEFHPQSSATIPPPTIHQYPLAIGPSHLSPHLGAHLPPPLPPPNRIPPALPPTDNAIVESRQQQGSPLAGTLLSESIDPATEQNLFSAALEKVAGEAVQQSGACSVACPTERTAAVLTCSNAAAEASTCSNAQQEAAQFAICQLYAIAESDERAGEFERADQWRALARELRAKNNPPQTLGDSAASFTAAESAPATADCP